MQHSYETDQTIPFAQLFARDVRAELRVNDIPVASAHPGLLVAESFPLRNVILQGANTVTLDVTQPGVTTGRGGWSPMAQARARVAIFTAGQMLDETGGQQVSQLLAPFTPETPNPQRIASRFASPIGGGWAWTRATPINPEDPGTRAALDQFFAGVHAVFQNRDMTPMLPLFQPSVQDFTRAYPLRTPAEVMANHGSKLAEGPDDLWDVVPLDPANVVYQPLAGGRLIRALDRAGEPLVRTVPMPQRDPEADPRVVAFTELVGVIDGRLQVLI